MKKKGGKGGWKIGGELSRYSNSRQTNTACYWNRINRERRGRDPYLFRDKFSPAGRGKKKITNHPAAPAVDLCIFIRGKSRFPRVSLSLSFFSPFKNDEIKIIGSRAFHGMEIEMRRETEPFDIFHPRVLMALRLNVPENLRHEQLAHYFTSMWILACIEFPIRIVEGFEHVLRRNVLRRGEENASFYLLFSIDRDLSPKSNNSSKITRVELKRSIIDLP